MVGFDEDILKFIGSIGGKDAISVVSLLKGKKNVSEFKIAEKLKITVNHIRSILYNLNQYNLVDFTRKKDKKKGWYIYYWTFDVERANSLISDLKIKRIEELKKVLKIEENNIFFNCPTGCVRLNFENALEVQFKCPECEQVLFGENNKKKIDKLKRDIRILEEELVVLENKKREKEEKERLKIKRKAKKKKIKLKKKIKKKKK